MQLAPGGLDAHLKKCLKGLYTLHGDETLLVNEAADAVRANARARGYSERSVHVVSGLRFDWSEVLAAGGSQSLFADKQIIELRIPSGKPGKDGGLVLQQLAEQVRDDDATLTMVILPKLDKAAKGTAWFLALERHGVTVALDVLERHALPAWIAQRLARQDQRVAGGEQGQRALQFFADRVEGNLLAAHQEIQKLGLLYDRGELSLQQIENAVLDVARYDVFKLSEAVLAGHSARVQRMLDGLRAEGQGEVLVHWVLSEDIRALKRVKDALNLGRPLPVALREQRVWGVKERLFERVLPRLDNVALAHLLQAAHQVDGIVKGLKIPGWPTDGWLALQRLAMAVCAQCTGELKPKLALAATER